MRKLKRTITVGCTDVGGNNPISIQSMTTTKTEDVKATLKQISELYRAGCDIVRVAVPNEKAAIALSEICISSQIPVVADIHFDYRLALMAIKNGVSKIRINPGNIGSEEGVSEVAEACNNRNKPIRIGVNSGSLDKKLLIKYGGPTPEALVESAFEHIRLLEKYDFNNVCVSIKSSDVSTMMKAYMLMHESSDIPLHLGVTEAGTANMGKVKSACGIGGLLALGIGDTIRVSLTANPVEEIQAAKDIIKAVGLHQSGVNVISCPTCGRCNIDLISIAKQVETQVAYIQQKLTIAVMGCVVNGPGEAKEADYGIAGGLSEGIIFKKGIIVKKVPQGLIVNELLRMIEKDLGVFNVH